MPAIQLHVSDMACGACAAAIETAIQATDPQAQVQAAPASKQVTVITSCSAAAIQVAIATAGYHPELR